MINDIYESLSNQEHKLNEQPDFYNMKKNHERSKSTRTLKSSLKSTQKSIDLTENSWRVHGQRDSINESLVPTSHELYTQCEPPRPTSPSIFDKKEESKCFPLVNKCFNYQHTKNPLSNHSKSSKASSSIRKVKGNQ